MGRADYLGPVVNQAARVCDSAAHGGQVALEEGLGRSVLQHWHKQQQQQHAAGEPDAAALSDASTACQVGAVQDAGNQPAAGVRSSARPDAGTGGAASASAGRVQVQVSVQQLGCFLFKGCAKSLQMLHFTPQKLAGRTFPAEPPRGKGVRLSYLPGLVEVASVSLPNRVAGLPLFA